MTLSLALRVAHSIPSDVELIGRAARGDVDAFAQIYDRHAGTVLALTRRMLASATDAQDLLHDVFLEAWLAVREYDPTRASVRVWLLVRARSRALDRRASRSREAQACCALEHEETTRVSQLHFPHTERQIALREGLRTLEPGVRETLELTYFEGLTALEVSQHMQVPEGTVRSRLARGLSCLQQALSLLEERRP